MTKRNCIGFAQQTVSDTVAALTAATLPRLANEAEIQVNDANKLRYRLDGTAVTSSVGSGLSASDVPLVVNGNLKNVSLVRDAGSSVVINIHYYHTTD